MTMATLTIVPLTRSVYELYLNSKLHKFGELPRSDDDVGVDLYVPEDVTIGPNETKLVKSGVRIQVRDINNEKLAWDLVARSSISKTPLILHNNIGIIDPKFNDEVLMALRNLGSEPYTIKAGTRLTQCVMPDRVRPIIALADVSFCDNGEATGLESVVRSGFGSTGQ